MTDEHQDTERPDDEPWADLRTTSLLTGLPQTELMHAMETGEVRFTMTLASHPGVVMLSVSDARRLAGLHRLADEVYPHDDGSRSP